MTMCFPTHRAARLLTIRVAVFALVPAAAAALAHAQPAYEQDPINYSTAPASDPIARLQAELDAGSATLEHDGRHGYLASLLERLNIPASSQTLVFSKTSLQRDAISPQTPRALYFDDDTYVGWVRHGGAIEVATTDPNLGTVFYTLDQRRADRPRFVRQTDSCTQCHGSTMTDDVPGLLVRSVHTDPNGQPVLTAGTALTTQASPLEERWGGWYVTGTHGDRRHKGNVLTKHRDDDGPLDVEAGANLTDLSGKFDPAPYLGGGHSDIVAHLVLAHQAEVHNLLTRANFQTRLAVRDSQAINAALGTSDTGLTESAGRRIQNAGERLLKALLFCDEELLADRVTGTSTFATDFAARGPRDGKGRSLRDLDLRKRMFRYSLSYLIYTPAFDGLPAQAKDYVYRRLFEVLSGQDKGKDFRHLSADDRQAILEILRETKPGLPDYFQIPRQPL
jgi:hypothetical protein